MADLYEQRAIREVKSWQKKMQKKPSFTNRITAAVQEKLNSFYPDKLMNAITSAIKGMTRAVLFGATYTSPKPLENATLQEREEKISKRIETYKHTGAVEGGVTGFGGFLSSLADFPLLLSIKIKMLFDIAALYGFDVKDYRERLFILYVFQLAFSSDEERKKVFLQIEDWERISHTLPEDIHAFDWETFQVEYRDYMDIAKLAQMIPYIGAAVGAITNYRLINKLGDTAKQAYRMRLLPIDKNLLLPA